MSVATVIGRVQELQALISPPAAVDPVAAGRFASQLAGAQSGLAPAMASAPVAAAGAAGGETKYDAEIQAAAARHGIDPALLKGLIRQESNFNPNAGSPAGAQGLTQLMPGTAASLGVTNSHDPAQAIDGGAKYLRQQLDAFGGDVTKALAAYNAGPGAVKRHGGVPPYAETQNYVRQVQAFAAQYATTFTPSPTPAPVAAGASSLTESIT